MIVVPFSVQKIYLTKEERERFVLLKDKLANSISPGEATYYKNELDSLVSKGKTNRY